MATETHVNALREDFEKAYAEAVGAVGKLKDAAHALFKKYEGEEPKVAQAAEKAVDKVEEEAKNLEADAKGGDSKKS